MKYQQMETRLQPDLILDQCIIFWTLLAYGYVLQLAFRYDLSYIVCKIKIKASRIVVGIALKVCILGGKKMVGDMMSKLS